MSNDVECKVFYEIMKKRRNLHHQIWIGIIFLTFLIAGGMAQAREYYPAFNGPEKKGVDPQALIKFQDKIFRQS